jgi:pimeloyl-ACP methyl ester carboxylesterase
MKKPIVLVHGLFGHLKDPKILGSISEFGVFAPDLLGYGEHSAVQIDAIALEDQADHVARYIQNDDLGMVNLVGHSVGGAVAVLVAKKYPQMAASLTSVKGNFTLKDAFWSGQIAQKALPEVEQIVDGYKADPDCWISSAGVPLNEWTKALARSWLNNQPASTIKAQARAVVEATGKPDYLDSIRSLMTSDLPFHLIAGERSRDGWDVPEWAAKLATSNYNIPNTGHLMMAEDPEGFGLAVKECQQ